MHWYIGSMLWLIHTIFPNFSTELWPLIDFRIMFILNILRNNWWIFLVVTLIFFMPKRATTKISTLAGYHVVLAMLLLKLYIGIKWEKNYLSGCSILHNLATSQTQPIKKYLTNLQSMTLIVLKTTLTDWCIFDLCCSGFTMFFPASFSTWDRL